MKFIIDNITWIILAAASGGALLFMSFSERGKKATPLQVTQLINRGKITILDVRDAAEFGNGHLRDAKNIPLKDLASRVGELDKVKAKAVVVICQSGSRAGKACSVLEKAGFADVVSLDGGLAAWTAAGLPLVK